MLPILNSIRVRLHVRDARTPEIDAQQLRRASDGRPERARAACPFFLKNHWSRRCAPIVSGVISARDPRNVPCLLHKELVC